MVATKKKHETICLLAEKFSCPKNVCTKNVKQIIQNRLKVKQRYLFRKLTKKKYLKGIMHKRCFTSGSCCTTCYFQTIFESYNALYLILKAL